MIVAWLIRIGIPARFHRWALYAALAVLAVALVLWWFARHDAAVIERHEGNVAAEVDRKDDAGDTAARETAAAEKATIQKENDDARKAADGSDDPLKHALDRLH